jgi:pimeloyl-ACP methyl ester carboxylesterase/2-polyprenyl-6-methoxyphenol hydroxylase-like FAD-dependent oxidoreductase
MSKGPEQKYDVVIVGASLAGSVAALLYGRRGLNVALLERHSDLSAFKRVCTHLIQASATPMMRRHGLDKVLEEAGAVRYRLEAWTRWGWVKPPQFQSPETAEDYGYNIRREAMDPLLRRLASETPGVDLKMGHTVEAVLREGDRVTGVTVRDQTGSRADITGALVVAADGRNSQTAELAGVGCWTIENKRVAYGAYYRNLPHPDNGARLWFLEPDIAYIFPTDDGQTIIATMFPREKLPMLKARIHSDFEGIFKDVPDFPTFDGAEMVGNVIGMASMPNQWRKRPPKGLAFVGDAAVAADPLFGVGCGWGFESAEWLVDATAPALAAQDSVDAAVGSYRKRLRKGLVGHYLMVADYSRARQFNPGEKLFFSGAARDAKTAYKFGQLGARIAPARGFFSPLTMGRAAVVNLRHRRRGNRRAPAPRGLGLRTASEITVDGIRTPLIQAGPVESDEAVVFVHGNPGSSADWSELLEKAGGFSRAVAVNLPGFGEADKPEDFDYTVEGYAGHLQATFELLGIRRAHLVLHDFGGAFGLIWALRHPESVASVTLINTGALQRYRWHYLAKIWRTPVLGEIFNATANRPAFHLLLKHGNRRRLPKHFVDGMYNNYDSGTKRAILRLYRATEPAAMQALVEPLRNLDLPALVVWGANDPYIPVKQANLQTNAFPRARVEILPDSGHWPFIDDPDGTARLVIPFLREQTASKVGAKTGA